MMSAESNIKQNELGIKNVITSVSKRFALNSVKTESLKRENELSTNLYDTNVEIEIPLF